MMKFVVTCAFGLEKMLKTEIKRLGFEITSVNSGAVTVTAPLSAVASLNLNLRCAERVYLKIFEFKAQTFDELFAGISSITWHNYLLVDSAFPINAKSHKSKLFSLSDIQSISKKAIVNQLKLKYKCTWFKETGSEVKIEIRIENDIVSVLFDSSGEGLHKRGYREKATAAPLKETTAAALVLLSNWYGDDYLIDPMCGSGTILIEAAMIRRNVAAGLGRKFAFENWHFVDKEYLKIARQAAYKAIDYDKELKIMGMDIDKRAISIAKDNAELAGVDDCIEFKTADFLQWKPNYKIAKIISNLPYGERLSDSKSVLKLYKYLGKISRDNPSYSIFALTSHTDFEQVFGRKADRNRKLYNAKIKCYYYQIYGKKQE